MFKSVPLEVVQIRHAVPDGSGAVVWNSREAAAVLLNAAEKLQPETSGIVAEEQTFLLISETPPVPGDRLCRQQEELEIRSVRIFRSLEGKIIAYRCIAR